MLQSTLQTDTLALGEVTSLDCTSLLISNVFVLMASGYVVIIDQESVVYL